jgi:DUF2075 family protein
MIVYESDVQGFRADVLSNRIEEIIRERYKATQRRSVSVSEVKAWANSLAHMDRVLSDHVVPADAGVAIEFVIPGSTKRMDFVLTGFNELKRKTVIIVELKQWTKAKRTSKDAIVETFLGGSVRETSHPSYQAWSYAALLQDFNEAVRDTPIDLRPCAYLHNCETGEVIHHAFYREHVDRAPAFLKDDAAKLREFIQRHIRHGDKRSVIFEILNGQIRPSKSLADSLGSMLRGRPEFVLIDDQKLVYETALQLAKKAQAGSKQVLIVEGGPGTGKTVLAINLLVRLIEGHLNAKYVTKNAAPRAVYEAKLKGDFKKSAISNLFSGPDSLYSAEPDTYGALILDEAHRLREKSGIFANLGENQIAEAIRASRFCVFFVDDAQQVTLKDIGSSEAVRQLAKRAGAQITQARLESQFRCNGSDGYLGWIDHTLGVRSTANSTLDGVAYDFRVCSDPEELRLLIEERNRVSNRARLVAGYCWEWKSKKSSQAKDVVIPGTVFEAQWNLTEDGGTWIMRPDSVKQVGCIHTCQGLELDYVGVILGHDYVIRNGRWVVYPERRAKGDRSIHGYGKLLLNDRVAGEKKIAEIVRNTYRTLMTRGSRGCYVYSVDPETNKYLRTSMGREQVDESITAGADFPEPAELLPFRYLDDEVAQDGLKRVRCFPSLKAAAGAFLSGQADEFRWVELPDEFSAGPDDFVVQVRGNSMNRKIPDGAWCLFRKATPGSRQGKIVLVQHVSISDPANGGSYTVKRYRSEKRITAEGWSHESITLWPESYDRSYLPLLVPADAAEDFRVIGELIAVL